MLWSLPQIWPYYKAYIFPYWSSVLLPMVQITLMSSVYTTIIMSWERYVRICMVSKVGAICFPSGVLAYQCKTVEILLLRKYLKQCPNVSTTPLRQWGFRQCLPFSWTTLRGKHCQHPIAVMRVVDTFGPCMPVCTDITASGFSDIPPKT